jgi:hypothetical protein
VVLARSAPRNSGFQAILTKVLPSPRVLAPATKGLQFPTGSVMVPQTQPFEAGIPGELT